MRTIVAMGCGEAADRVVDGLLRAVHDADVDGALHRLCPDVLVEIVGDPGGPLRGREAVRSRLAWLVRSAVHETDLPVRRWAGEHAVVDERVWQGRLVGGGEVRLRVLSVFQLGDGLIARITAWPVRVADTLPRCSTSV